jgi:hypothetical protein
VSSTLSRSVRNTQAPRVQVENQRGQVSWYETTELVRLRGASGAGSESAAQSATSAQYSQRVAEVEAFDAGPSQPDTKPRPEPEPEVSVDRQFASPSELEAMSTLKQRLSEGNWLERPGTKHMFHVFGGEDKCLIRFLRAYSFKDIDTSFKQFTTSVEFREENQVAEITDPQAFIDSDPELKMYWPGAYPTFTPEYPVQFFKLSHARPADFVARFPEERLTKFFLVRARSLGLASCICVFGRAAYHFLKYAWSVFACSFSS